jgi:hypothetical protein
MVGCEVANSGANATGAWLRDDWNGDAILITSLPCTDIATARYSIIRVQCISEEEPKIQRYRRLKTALTSKNKYLIAECIITHDRRFFRVELPAPSLESH